MSSRALIAGASALGLAALAVGCGSSSSTGTAASDKVAVTAGDTTCVVDPTTMASGPRTFAVKNAGADVTEVYVYDAGGTKIIGEVENIGPGTSRDLKIDDLGAGTYQVACKPGQKGDGIRTTITVTGTPSTAVKVAEREVELSAKDNTFTGMEGFSAKVGETVEFKMRNTDKDAVLHEFEVVTPDGATLGEIGETKPGETGEVTLTFKAPGTYTYQCVIEGHDAQGMKGTFTVS